MVCYSLNEYKNILEDFKIKRRSNKFHDLVCYSFNISDPPFRDNGINARIIVLYGLAVQIIPNPWELDRKF